MATPHKCPSCDELGKRYWLAEKTLGMAIILIFVLLTSPTFGEPPKLKTEHKPMRTEELSTIKNYPFLVPGLTSSEPKEDKYYCYDKAIGVMKECEPQPVLLGEGLTMEVNPKLTKPTCVNRDELLEATDTAIRLSTPSSQIVTTVDCYPCKCMEVGTSRWYGCMSKYVKVKEDSWKKVNEIVDRYHKYGVCK